MKTKLIKIFTLSLSIFTLLTSCNNENNNNLDDNDDDITIKDDEKTYKYGSIRSFEGNLSSVLDLNLLTDSSYTYNLLDTYITFTYQKVDEEIPSDESYRKIKFHLNLDLYYSESMFESSIVSKYLLPVLFSDFKYQNILNNATDLDLYYLGDGILYTTISRFDINDSSLRNDRNNYLSLDREIIGTSKMDISSIFSTINSLGSSASDFIFQEITKTLNGLKINIGDITGLLTSAILTIIDNGFNISLDSSGLSSLESLLKSILNFALDYFNVGLELDDSNLINISKFLISYTPLEIKAQILNEETNSSLLNLDLIRNDSNSLNIEPINSLEEDYLIQKEAIKACDNFYSLYDSYSLSSSYQSEIYSAISTINSLTDTQKERIKNFNNYLGYEVLTLDEYGNYREIKEESNLRELYNKMEDTLLININNDYNFIVSLIPYFNVLDSKYSSGIKYNLFNELELNNETNYNNFKNNISSYLNTFLDSIYENINLNLNKELTLKETLDNIYEITKLDDTIDSFGNIIDLDNISEDIKIKSYSTEFILDTIDIFDLEHDLFLDTFSQEIYSLYVKYMNSLNNDLLSLTKSSDLSLYNDLANNLLTYNQNDDLYNIFILISKSNSTYLNNAKNSLDELILNLINKLDNAINYRLDNELTITEIRLLLTKEKIEIARDNLTSLYNLIINSITSKLFKDYEANLTYIDKYYSLINELNLQLDRIS